MNATVRNVLIILAIAAAVYALPGGGDAATLFGALLSTAIIVAFVLIAVRVYRERRLDIDGLGDRYKGILYGAIALAVFAMAARARMWDDLGGAGVLLWLAMVGGASYALVLVWRHWREYA